MGFILFFCQCSANMNLTEEDKRTLDDMNQEAMEDFRQVQQQLYGYPY